MLFNKVLTSLHFHQIERVDFCDFGNKVRMKFNGVVIRAVRRELVMGFLREDAGEVFAPFWYDWFCHLGGLGDLGGDSSLVD